MKLPRPSGAAPFLLFLVLGTSSEPCRAEPPTRALLLLPSCPLEGLSEQELRSAVALELEEDGLKLARAGDGFGRSDVLLEVDSSCRPHAELTLRVLYQDKERSRTLSLDDLPPGTRSRLLALSLAELVERLEPAPPAAEPAPEGSAPADAPSPSESSPKPPESSPESRPEKPVPPRETNPTPPDTSSPPLAPPPVDTAPGRTPREIRTALEFAPELRWFSSGDALFGGRLGFDTTRVVAGAGLLLGRPSTEIGNIEAFLLHGFVGYRLVQQELTASWSAGFGPRIGVGWMEATGTPLDGEVSGTSAGAFYFDASAFGDLRYFVSPRFRVSLGVEGGISRGLTLLADGARAASYDGVFVAGFIGLMLSP